MIERTGGRGHETATQLCSLNVFAKKTKPRKGALARWQMGPSGLLSSNGRSRLEPDLANEALAQHRSRSCYPDCHVCSHSQRGQNLESAFQAVDPKDRRGPYLLPGGVIPSPRSVPPTCTTASSANAACFQLVRGDEDCRAATTLMRAVFPYAHRSAGALVLCFKDRFGLAARRRLQWRHTSRVILARRVVKG